MSTLKKQLIDALVRADVPENMIHVEYPASSDHGDYSTNAALVFAGFAKRSPRDVAQELIMTLKKDSFVEDTFERVEIAGPGFINFFVSHQVLAQQLSHVLQCKTAYGASRYGKGKNVIIEYSSPNTNKPLSLGHLRNNFIGMALGNLLKVQGYDTVMTQIINDRGVHICKSMLAYQLWGNGETPEQVNTKSDHFVGEYYVRYSKEEKEHPEIIERVRELLRKWEDGDAETRRLWEQMNQWVMQGWELTYKKIGSFFDFNDYESQIYDKGKDIVLDALSRGLLERVEGGALAIDLSSCQLGGRDDRKKILLRSDGTAMYITQDLYLAVKRYETYHPDKVLHVVGDEQLYHFKVLFSIMNLLGYTWVNDRYIHVSYGMMNLPEGKMKSREGTVVDADDLIASLESMARKEVLSRDPELADDALNSRAEAVALAALKFYILKVDPKTTMTYDPKASLDFEGNTGPYVQYTYARLSNILVKSSDSNEVESVDGNYAMNDQERRMSVLILRYPEILASAAMSYKPHYLTEYLSELCSCVNSWYASVHVLNADGVAREWRLDLIRSLLVVLRNGLRVLGITPLERM